MMKKIAGCLVLLLVATAVNMPVAVSQMEQDQPVIYTYVSQFQVPRAQWKQFNDDSVRSFLPIADKLVANGTILSYSTFDNIVHTPEGYTHGSVWSSTSIAGITKVLDELVKGGPQSAQLASTRHEDLLLQSRMYLIGNNAAAPAFTRVVCQSAKPDNPDAYSAAVKKYLWPFAAELVKQGVVSYVGIDSQYVNTGSPSLRCLVVSYPNAESLDKWANGVNTNFNKMSKADRDEFFGSTVADSRRDSLMRITHSGHK